MFRTWPAATMGLTVTLGVTGLEARARANPIDPTTTVEIVVITHASVPAEVSDRALLEAGRIYETAGVDVVWMNAEAAEHHPPRHLRLTFVVAAVAAAENPDALGFAANTGSSRGRLAFAFFPRVKNFARKQQIEVSLALGLVMAHEIGHLLLFFQSHAGTGIMRAKWGRTQVWMAAREEMVFSPDQAERIRRTIRESEGN